MTWMRFVPCLSSGGLLSSSGFSCSFAPYITSPHKHREVIYGANEQLTPEDDKSPPLDKQGTKRIQVIVGTFLYYGRAVDKKLLFGLIFIGYQHAAAKERTKEAIN